MTITKDVKSNVRPEELDTSSSKKNIYINKNIREEDTDIGTVFIYDQECYTKDEYYNLQFKELNCKIDNIMNTDNMTLEETIEYKISKIGEACTAAIYAGTDVTLFDGTTEHFSLTMTDQMNIQTQVLAILNLGVKEVAYHADKCNCRVYDYKDFLRISLSTSIYILEQTTYCNYLNNYIRKCKTKEEVLAAYYGMPLDAESMQAIQQVVQVQAQGTVQAITAKFGDVVVFG